MVRERAERFSPVFVTGASGFIGACLVRRLLDEGFDVHVLLREGFRPWRLREVLPRLHVHAGDVCDAPAVQRAIAQARPQTVYHLAAYGAYESQADAQRILNTNLLGTSHLLEASLAAGVRLFVSAGSSSEYGFKSEPMRESDRLEPNSVYAVAKAAQTHLCQLSSYSRAMATVAFRFFSVFGPWEEPTRLLPTLLRRAQAGLPLEMVSPEIAHDFIFIDDVLDAMLDLERLAAMHGEVFNLGSGVQTKLGALVELVRNTLSSRSEVRWGAMPHRRWDTTSWVADVTKARQQIGWTPRIALQEGVLRMIQWMATHGGEYGS
jgi:nucleoside-diphosphate-sugar epimerase